MSSQREPMPLGYDRLVEIYLIELFDADPINGRHVLGDIVEEDYKNTDKWAWVKDLIQCDSDEAKRRCIENEVRKDPGNHIAKKALVLFDRRN